MFITAFIRMKKIIFSEHALLQMSIRGATEDEVKLTINTGEKISAKRGRIAFRKNFAFNSYWKGKFYRVKQVMPIVVEENDRSIVVTVYTFYF